VNGKNKNKNKNKNRKVRWPAATEPSRGSGKIDKIKKKICYPLQMSEKCGTNPTVTKVFKSLLNLCCTVSNRMRRKKKFLNVFKKLSKSCQKNVKKFSKLSRNCQQGKLSKNCQKL
jgi:hypothetical protein